MNPIPHEFDELDDLLLNQLHGRLTPAESARLNQLLRSSATLRRAYAHAMLDAMAIRQYAGLLTAAKRPLAPGSMLRRHMTVFAAAVVIVGVLGLAVSVLVRSGWREAAPPRQPFAVLTDVHAAVFDPSDLPHKPGSALGGGMLRLRSGEVELTFRHGAQVTLRGPAELAINSGSHAFLRRGELRAYCPGDAHGFTIAAPGLAVVDLGTRFVMNVPPDMGPTAVRVNEGRVNLRIGDGMDAKQMLLHANEGLAIDPTGRVTALPHESEHERVLDFASAAGRASIELRGGALHDGTGHAVGFTARLPGTGRAIADADPNLQVDPAGGLRITSSQSDLNKNFNLDEADYPAIRLADLGDDGSQDVTVTAMFEVLDVPARDFQQFGVFVGDERQSLRGGLIHHFGLAYWASCNTTGGESPLFMPIASVPWRTVTMTIRRVAGVWRVTVNGHDVTPRTRPARFGDLHAGVFAAHQGGEPFRIKLMKFTASVGHAAEAPQTSVPTLERRIP